MQTFPKETIAALVGVHPRTILRWARDGCPYEEESGSGRFLFYGPDVLDWMLDTGRLEPSDCEHLTEQMQQAKLQYEQERAELKTIERRQKEGEIHEIEPCKQRRMKQIYAAKSILESIPRSAAPECVGRERGDIEDIIEQRVEDALHALADSEAEQKAIEAEK